MNMKTNRNMTSFFLKIIYDIFRFNTRIIWKIRNLYWSKLLNTKHCVISKSARLEGIDNFYIGHEVFIGRFAWLQCIDKFGQQEFTPNLHIGNGVKMSEFVHIGCALQVTIGDNCLFASKTLIIDHHHGGSSLVDITVCPAKRPLICSPVIIGNNVFLGDNVVVLPGVTIGENTIVGANSVVSESLPANCVAIGSPARVKKIIKGTE